jgi:hypothetical protein
MVNQGVCCGAAQRLDCSGKAYEEVFGVQHFVLYGIPNLLNDGLLSLRGLWFRSESTIVLDVLFH